ncbi:MAG: class I SAM-dependent methyltransferase [Actinomycetota bacterium]
MRTPAWNEDDSETFRRLAPVAVPARARQLAAVATLLPFAANEEFTIVELGSGEGLLTRTIAGVFSRARIVALDGSESMRNATVDRLLAFSGRLQVAPFVLEDDGWFEHLDGADAVVSSLVIHHLDRPGKQRLFEAVARRTSGRAAFVIADLVEPLTRQALELFAATWDGSTRQQARMRGQNELFELFRSTEWNIYRHPDPMDQPSPLVDQLGWLREAGFAVADCFWMEAGHAVYGGYKAKASGRIDHELAAREAEAALRTI